MTRQTRCRLDGLSYYNSVQDSEHQNEISWSFFKYLVGWVGWFMGGLYVFGLDTH